MASSHRKSMSGGKVERIHVDILRFAMYFMIALMAVILILQVCCLFRNPEEENAVYTLGGAKRSFSLTLENLPAFLLIPTTLVAFLCFYLKRYFRRNTHGSHMIIPYLERHPRNPKTKIYYMVYIAAMAVVSVVLAGILYVKHHDYIYLIPVITIACSGLVLYFLLQIMRERKRHYSHHHHYIEESDS